MTAKAGRRVLVAGRWQQVVEVAYVPEQHGSAQDQSGERREGDQEMDGAVQKAPLGSFIAGTLASL